MATSHCTAQEMVFTLCHLFLYPSSYSTMEEMLKVDQLALYCVGLEEMDLLVTMGGREEPTNSDKLSNIEN